MYGWKIFLAFLILLMLFVFFSSCSENFRRVDSSKDSYRLLLINKENGKVEYSNQKGFEIDVENGSLEFTDRKLDVSKYKIVFEKVK